MTLSTELSRLRTDHFVALILDNEVTVGEFVVDPPLTWIRFVQQAGVFRMADGYPNVLTMAQAKFEMRNWDEVSLPSIMRGLAELNDGVDYVLFGNNAGQGAAAVRRAWRLNAKVAGCVVAIQPERIVVPLLRKHRRKFVDDARGEIGTKQAEILTCRV